MMKIYFESKLILMQRYQNMFFNQILVTSCRKKIVALRTAQKEISVIRVKMNIFS